MKKKILCLAAAAALVTAIGVPSLSGFAKEKPEPMSLEDIRSIPLIIYGYGPDDPKLPVHDLNDNNPIYREPMSLEEIQSIPLILYGPDDERMTRPIDLENAHVLEDVVLRGDYTPTRFYNLGRGSYVYSFSNVYNYVYTDYYFDTNANGFISVSISNISGPVNIQMIEYESGTVIHDWTGNPKDVIGVGFPADPSKYYYFMFRPAGTGPISGSGEIFWDN